MTVTKIARGAAWMLTLLLRTAAGATADTTDSATYLACTAEIIAPDDVLAGEEFTFTCKGTLAGGNSWSVHAYRIYLDATWSYDTNHLVSVTSGTLIAADGFEWGAECNEKVTDTLDAGTYTCTFIFGNRSFGHGYYDVAVDATMVVRDPTLPVEVDIKPTSCPNPLNVKSKGKSKGVVPVAILGSADLDIRDIDPDSVTLEGVEALRSAREDVAEPVTGRTSTCECTTDGPDGYLDLTLKFAKADLIDALGTVNDGDVLTLTLRGSLKDGTAIEGTDCMVIRAVK